MMENEQTGVLSVVAKTAGVKILVDGVESKWINPSEGAKKAVLADLEALKGKKGQMVQVYFNDKNEYTAIVLSESEKIPEEVIEELIEDDEESNVKNLIQPQPKEHEQLTIPHDNYFTRLMKVKCETQKIGTMNLTYISWAEAWAKLKEAYPLSSFEVHENTEGMPYFADSTGGFVKVSVTVKYITHTVHLPVMDNRNQSIKIENMTTFAINKNIQRALTKAIALHGVGLYVYNGSDFPELK